ncbi:palmitoyltransferase swf1 [Metarhizium album ARSEF 1941]|uniref:Palmitoyltransferase n=1 Tax=Metarhizium album (strain ARSEF 1941) TaxID=1081103 RepID=A0A0B2X1T7_METAS|nr:palmitoyltransferase swf1 [Metarhizium album ARSEF 1941]KHN99100.1 palmitoyltransferase swf1 [Metarhizium album ARSEF 1941]
MISLKWALTFVFVVSFAVFVTFFGRLPIFRRTPIGLLHRLIWIHIPNTLLSIDNRLASGRVTRSLSRVGDLVMHERHPTVVIFFLALMIGGEYLYLPSTWHRLGPFTKLTVIIAVVLPYLFLYLSCVTNPGYITEENHSYHMSLYPYDHALFHPGAACKTCRFLKPPRSKHCSLCKRCVAKADHHCIFINSCVGYGNQHWFILLLVSTAVLCTYGGLLGASLLSSSIKQQVVDWSPWSPLKHGWAMYVVIWGWGIQTNIGLGATTLLAALSAPLVWGLVIYTMYLVYCGTTTNESFKWSVYKDDMEDGYAFRRLMPLKRERDLVQEPICRRWPAEPEMVLAATDDGRPPPAQSALAGEGDWERVWKLKNVENLYDLGLWHNLRDVFVRDCAFGVRADDPPSERGMRRNFSKSK